MAVAQAPLPTEAFEKYAGQWVAIRDGKVVAASEDFDSLVQDERVDKEADILCHVPRSSTYFF